MGITLPREADAFENAAEAVSLAWDIEALMSAITDEAEGTTVPWMIVEAAGAASSKTTDEPTELRLEALEANSSVTTDTNEAAEGTVFPVKEDATDEILPIGATEDAVGR